MQMPLALGQSCNSRYPQAEKAAVKWEASDINDVQSFEHVIIGLEYEKKYLSES